MSPSVPYQRVKEHLEALKLHAALSELDPLLEAAGREQQTPVEVLDHLLGIERDYRCERRVQANLRLSGIPNRKTLEEFDYEAQESVPRRTIEELATLRFLHNGENLLLFGPTGVGKTHIATGLSLKAIEQGHRVYFLTLRDLVTKARLARERNRIHVLHTTILGADLFVLDEIGFQPLDQKTPPCSSKSSTTACQASKSTIVSSNKSYGQWSEIFPDPVLAVAPLDRLLHHAVTLNIRGDSYRLRHRKLAGLAALEENR